MLRPKNENLYPNINFKDYNKKEFSKSDLIKTINILTYADGKHTLFDIANKLNLNLKNVEKTDRRVSKIDEISKRQFSEFPEISNSASKDLLSFYERDPACNFFYQPFLYYKGFLALQIYRIGRSLYESNQTSSTLHVVSFFAKGDPVLSQF